MVYAGPGNEILRVRAEGNPRLLTRPVFGHPLTLATSFDGRAPTGLAAGSPATLVMCILRISLQPANALFVNVAGAASEADRPDAARMPIHSTWGGILL